MSEGIRLVLGFSPGSASDQIARAIAPALSRELGAPIDIELMPGNNGSDAARMVATAAADARTLFMATLGTHALAPLLDRHLPYDAQHDFAPVSLVASAPLVLGCHPALGVRNAGELIEAARHAPRELTYGTSALGGAPHLAAELFQSIAGIELRHVRYDETERLYADVEAGVIALTFNNMMSMLPRCRAGLIRALAVTSARRSAAAGDLPSIAEGLPGYDMSNWLGIVAPRATPAPVVAELSRAISAAVHSAEVAAAFKAAGVTPVGGMPATLAEHIAAELRRWRPVVARFRDVDALPAP